MFFEKFNLPRSHFLLSRIISSSLIFPAIGVRSQSGVPFSGADSSFTSGFTLDVHGCTTTDLGVISFELNPLGGTSITEGVTIPLFVIVGFPVAGQIASGGFTIDLPPNIIPISETEAVEAFFFKRLFLFIASISDDTIPAFSCFASVLIASSLAASVDNSFFPANKARLAGVPPESEIQSVILTALFALDRLSFLSKLSAINL